MIILSLGNETVTYITDIFTSYNKTNYFFNKYDVAIF